MKVLSAVLGVLFTVHVALAQDTAKAPAKPAAAPANVLLADCVSFKDKKLVVKFRLDEGFEKYVASPFIYPRQGSLKDAKVGETYLVTFLEEEAAHNVKQARLVDEKRRPETIPDRSLIGKVVAVSEKAVPGKAAPLPLATIEWKQDENIKKLFSREQTFPIRNNAVFSQGQVLRFVFGPDNRHCSPYPLKEKKEK